MKESKAIVGARNKPLPQILLKIFFRLTPNILAISCIYQYALQFCLKQVQYNDGFRRFIESPAN